MSGPTDRTTPVTVTLRGGSLPSPSDPVRDVAVRSAQARRGQTVAAALLENGIRSWRRTRHQGAPRGAFCGIGICYDCLLTVDGQPDQRACLVTVQDGMTLDLDLESDGGEGSHG